MATSNAVLPWSLTMPAGSMEQWTFTFTQTDQITGQTQPYPVSGASWEYIVRVSATDTTPGGLFVVNTTPSAYGVIVPTATSVLSQAVLTIYPAATSALAPGQYYHALWMNPGTTAAYTWVTGNLTIAGNPQP